MPTTTGYNNTLNNDQLKAIYGDWQGDSTDCATNGMLDRKNQTQRQEVYQILLQRSWPEATPL